MPSLLPCIFFGISPFHQPLPISSLHISRQGERTAPYISLLTPKRGALIIKSLPLKASASDKSGIQTLFVSVSGTKKERVNSTTSILYTSRKLKNASITVSAYDTLGNARIASITITHGKVSGVRYY